MWISDIATVFKLLCLRKSTKGNDWSQFGKKDPLTLRWQTVKQKN